MKHSLGMGFIGRIKRLIVKVFVGLFLIVSSFLASAGAWMPSSDVMIPADALVVLSGNPYRALKAAEIYQKGIVKKIYLGRPRRGEEFALLEKYGISIPREETINQKILEGNSVPAESIVIYGREVASTIEEAEELYNKMPEDVKSLLVVTSPYHAFRARLIFNRIMPDIKINVVVSSEEFPLYWWTDQSAAKNTILEFCKIIFYFMGGAFRLNAVKP